MIYAFEKNIKKNQKKNFQGVYQKKKITKIFETSFYNRDTFLSKF